MDPPKLAKTTKNAPAALAKRENAANEIALMLDNGLDLSNVWLSDETRVETNTGGSLNSQNDRKYSPAGAKRDDVQDEVMAGKAQRPIGLMLHLTCSARKGGVLLQPHFAPKRLVIRLKTRKNSRPGAILIRNCVCTEGRKELLCPLHSFWEFIQANVQRGGRLFPGISKSSANKVLKKKLSLMNFESAKRFPSRAFRRGAAMEIQGSGTSMGQIMRAGGWSSSAFKVYLSLDKAEGEEIDRILTRQEVPDSSSEEAVE